jgi:6-phosphogluconolactonase
MTTTVYVSCADSAEIAVLRLDAASGALQVLQMLAVGGAVMPLALSPDRRCLYAALRSEPYRVVSLAIDPVDGRLHRLGESPLPDSMAYIATDRSGRWLLAASYGGHCVSVSPIDDDGTVQPALHVVPTEPNAHAIQADPSNRHVYATCLGGACIRRWQFDASSGALTPSVPPLWLARAQSGPRHFVFHPNGRTVYLLNELDATIDTLAFDATDGALRGLATTPTMPPGVSGLPWAADLHLTPDGRLLYSSERRSSTLAAFRVDAQQGSLTPIGHVDVPKQPRGFAIDPSGRCIVVAGQRSNSVAALRIDTATGTLSRSAEVTLGLNPTWAEIQST